MDQNRCLLDVIDNPQLLQSFLESESSAEQTTNNSSANKNNNNRNDNQDNAAETDATEAQSATIATTNTITTTATTTTTSSSLSPTPTPPSPTPVTSTFSTAAFTTYANPNETETTTVSASPSANEISAAPATVQEAAAPAPPVSSSFAPTTISEATTESPSITTTSDTSDTTAITTEVAPTEPTTEATPTDSGISTTSFDPKPATTTQSTTTTTTTTETSGPTTESPPITFSSITTAATTFVPSDSSPATTISFTTATTTTTAATTTPLSSHNTIAFPSSTFTDAITTKAPAATSIATATTTTTTTTSATVTPSTTSVASVTTASSLSTSATKTTPTPSVAKLTTTTAPAAPTTTPATTTATATKPVTSTNSPKKSTPRTSKAKKNATNTNNQSPVTPAQTRPILPNSYMSSPMQQQQIVFHNNNSGIRQQAILAPSPMGQPMGGIPQQQRVIQIQTANGPMYFAIAPGPATMNSPMTNQQQPGMQSHQYPSQQLCFQSNNSVMINRPQMGPNMTQQPPPQQQQQQNQPSQQQQQAQQQQQNQQPLQPQQPPSQQQMISSQSNNVLVNGPVTMIQSPQSHQPRLGAPMMAGQALAIPQNSQQQNVVLPSSQPMMMPRMSNQIILNKPLNSPGPLLPGQQQFIQILTPNGPMLLALPAQQPQQQVPNSAGPNITMTNNNNTNNINNNNNPSMIDYNNQAPHSQAHSQPMMQQSTLPSQQQHIQQTTDISLANQSATPKSATTTSTKTTIGSKSGIDLADLLLDCGILPEDRTMATQSPINIKSSQSPSIQLNSPMPSMTQMGSPMPPVDSPSLPTNQPMTAAYAGQPMSQQQPIRITIGPDGQMMMPQTLYRPMMTTNPLGQPHMNAISSNNIIPSSSPMTMTSNSLTPNSSETNSDNSSTKKTAKGKGTAVKRSRSKKTDIDNFPILKTPKIAQQQQQQQQQQQHQQQLQAVTVLPMTVLVGDQNKVISGPDVKPNVAQLAGGQQVSLAKIVTPVMQTASLKPHTVNSNIIQSSIPSANILASPIGQKQAACLNSVQNTQLVSDSGNSINASNMNVTNSTAIDGSAVSTLTTSSTSQISSSGNVTTNLLHRVNTKPGTVESNPHISSSLMPTISLTVDTLKIEQNGLKTFDGHQVQNLKAVHSNNNGLTTTTTTTLVLHSAQGPHQTNQVQQVARQIDIRAQSILNQLIADQNAALNPQVRQSFKSVEDACKRLLRYHVFDTQTVSEAQIKKVDEIFEAAVESLINRKRSIYDKYRLLILKQSMKTVPSSEDVMLEQVFVNDELLYIKRERELFRDYEAHLEDMKPNKPKSDSKLDSSKDDCALDYFAFGENSPKQNNQEDVDNATHSRDVDDWLLTDKWGESRYPSVPDSEAATAIESILNEELR